MPARPTRSRRVIDAADFGARGDAVHVTDAAMTSGSATLTSASAAFDAGDVGKIVAVAGAASGGAVLSTTISAVVSATQVTLAASAAATVSSALARFGSDNTAALQAAHNRAADLGFGEIVVPAGRYMLGSKVDVFADSVTLTGAGIGATEFWQSGTHLLFRGTWVSGPYASYCHLQDFSMVGLWEFRRSLGGDNDRAMYVLGYERLVVERVESVYSRQMGIVAGFVDEGFVSECRVRFCARDGINASSCGRMVVTGNHIRGCFDDAIAVHTNTTTGNPPPEGHVISGNIVEDSFGIKVLGATKVAITSNTISRPKAYGVHVSRVGAEGENDSTDVVIANNVISDVIQGTKFGAGSERYGIFVRGDTTGFVAPVVGGATPTYTRPETLGYVSNTAAAQNAGAQGIVISGNTVRQSLPPVAAYSTWGHGQAFTSSGFTNPDMSTGFDRTTFAVAFGGAVLSASVTGNVVENVQSGVWFESTATFVGDLNVCGNVFRRFSQYAILAETASALRGRIRFVDNVVDGDPYFDSANRGAGGRWSAAAQQPGGVDAVNYATVEVAGNAFRNVNQVLHSNAASVVLWGANTYHMAPDAAYNLFGGAATDNRGIRVPAGLDHPDARLVWEDSDPTSATYGAVTGTSAGTGSAAAMPTAGAFVAGMFVRNRAVTESGSASSRYTIAGWQRLTTGTGHVLNTDWRELRALTGN